MNVVIFNSIQGNIVEFIKDANSSSTSGSMTLSTVTASALAELFYIMQVEGTNATNTSLKLYASLIGSTTIVAQFNPNLTTLPNNLQVNAATVSNTLEALSTPFKIAGHTLGNSATYTAAGGQHVTSVTVTIAGDGTLSITGTSS
jgi:hypothetical protein